MAERKVLQKYYPPDFDPSKIKRRKGIVKDTQMTVRLMAPYSMRCSKCGEYIYRGKKFNARKETAVGSEYMGIKVFRFYIKCPVCSSEITFKTDPKNGDFTPEHGATRNFDNWKENDPTGQLGVLPGAEDDDEYDSEGNDRETRAARDAMADLERSQDASRREMETMDQLADLRQRNARIERSADPTAMLAALHAEKESAEAEQRRLDEEEEDDELVAKYFSKIPVTAPADASLPAEVGDASVSVSVSASDADSPAPPAPAPAAITVKRLAATAEPSVAALLAAKGKTAAAAAAPAPAQVKRKRGDMQKILGIKKKK